MSSAWWNLTLLNVARLRHHQFSMILESTLEIGGEIERLNPIAISRISRDQNFQFRATQVAAEQNKHRDFWHSHWVQATD